MISTTSRFYFDSIDTAAQALLTVLEDARETERYYSFGSLTASQILSSGLLLTGEIDEVVAKLEQIPDVTRYDE